MVASKRAVLGVFVGVCAAILAVRAQADVIDITGDTAAYGYDTATLNTSSGGFPNGIEVYTGADLITGTDLSTSSPFSAIAFCVDIHDYLQNVPYTFTQGALAGTTQDPLITDPVKQTQVAALISHGNALLTSGQYAGQQATEVSAALQIAVWVAENQAGDTGYEVTRDANDPDQTFWLSNVSDPNDVTLAMAYLGDVEGSNPAWTVIAPVYSLQALSPTVNQTLAYDPAAPIPEPGTLGLFGLGLAGLAALRRRRASGG
jgi:hypothetical protein